MAAAFDAYQAWRLYKQVSKPGREDEFMRDHPAEWAIVREVIKVKSHG